MAYLNEEAVWKEGVYQLEVMDPVIGGPKGISNWPHKDLACRTAYAKEHLDTLEENLGGWTEERGEILEDKTAVLEEKVADILEPGVMYSLAGTRDETIEQGTEVTVPVYTVGANQLLVTVFNVACVGGAHFFEVGEEGEESTAITFAFDIPDYMDIYVRSR